MTLNDDTPAVKIIDFGVAKAIGVQNAENSLFTADGQMVGTPAYMSPEQASMSRLDVDTRSDVYSLGVLLYELLTGTTPIETARLRYAGYGEIERLIRDVEPPRPSTRLSALGDSAAMLVAGNRATDARRLHRILSGDLDWIVMKAIDKDPNRRYSSPGSFADDVERYLSGEAILARPPLTAYRIAKFAGRHRVAVVAAVAVSVSLLSGTALATWQAMRAHEAERGALEARDDAAEQLRLTKRSEARANSVLKFFQDKVLSAARPKGQEGGLSRDATVREALDRAEPEIAKAFAGEPLVEASIRNTLGVSYWYLGDQEKALAQQERAVALRRQEHGPEHPETVGAMNDLAIVLDRMGRFAEEQRILEEVVAVKRRTLGPEDPVTLRSVNNLAIVLAMQGLLEHAAELAKDTLEIQRRVEGPESITTLRSAYNLAIMRRHLGRWAEARPLFDESLETLRRVHGPDHQDTLRAVNGLGELLLDQRRPAEARALFEEALKGQRSVLGPRSDETVQTMINLADTARLQKRFDEAPPAGRGGRRAEPDHPRARAPPDTLRPHHPLQHRPRPGPPRRGPQGLREGPGSPATHPLREDSRGSEVHGRLCLDACGRHGPRLPRPASRDRAGERADPELAEGPRCLDDPRGGPLPHRSLEGCDRRAREVRLRGRGLGAIQRRQRLLRGDGVLAARRKGERARMLREDLAVGGDSQSAGRGRTGALSIGGLRLAGYLGPETAREGRGLILNPVQSETPGSARVSDPAVGATGGLSGRARPRSVPGGRSGVLRSGTRAGSETHAQLRDRATILRPSRIDVAFGVVPTKFSGLTVDRGARGGYIYLVGRDGQTAQQSTDFRVVRRHDGLEPESARGWSPADSGRLERKEVIA